MDANQLMTFGDVRRLVVQTVMDLRSGAITPTLGLAIAANMKVLNDNIQVEINAGKLALATEGKAHSFGRIVSMGQRLIGNNGEQSA